MIKEIITYPTPPSVEFSVDVRVFNENIVSLIEDLIDTIEANNLEALTAFQIGSYYNVIVVKNEDGSYLELLNPRVISNDGKITSTEKTAYFPGLSAEVTRYDKINLVYQDRDGNNLSLKVEGTQSVIIQRKIDYTFGASFIQKLSEDEKVRFETKLEYGSDVSIPESCPTTFKRDVILKVINIGMILMLLSLISSFFISESETLETIWTYQLDTSYILLALNIIYFFYAQYEGKLYTSCSSCQLGNIIGTAVISLVKLSLIMISSYFLINPS